MIRSLDNILDLFSKRLIVICIFSMLFLSLASIGLRWFSISFHWIDPLVRHLVFLAAFLGGSLATGSRHHIKIDVLSRMLEKSNNQQLQKNIDRVVSTVTLIATLTLVWGSVDLAIIEFEFGKKVFLGIHSGYLLSIIPFGMGLISLRLLLRLLISFTSLNDVSDDMAKKV